MTFCRAKMLPGFELVANLVGLEAAVARADLVLTGEGSLDLQTLEGKPRLGWRPWPGRVADRSSRSWTGRGRGPCRSSYPF